MHITHITDHNVFDPDSFSGTPFWISKELQDEETILHNLHLHIPHTLLPPLEEIRFRLKQIWQRFTQRSHLSTDYFTRRSEYVADNLNPLLANLKTDVILTSHTPISAAFLETTIPIVYWTDAVYAAIANFYPRFRWHHPDTHWDGHVITKTCLMNAKRLIFSSEWAARTATEFYGISPDKIKIVPFGANIEISHTFLECKELIKSRAQRPIKLLFVGKEWYRKGGDFALKITEELHKSGYAVELTIIGCQPPQKTLPDYVKCIKFLSKNNSEEIKQLKQYYSQSHFLLLPTQADACPIVFAEANAFALPCITTFIGGIPTAIKNNINGMTFSLEATIKEYCDYITNLIDNPVAYQTLCLSAFNEYQTRLNWKTATKQVKLLISEIL